MANISVKHSGNTGDLWAALPAIRELSRKVNKRVVLYLNLGVKAWYYEGANHPIKDGDGDMVMMNEYMYSMARPLLLNQPYIEDVRIYQGEKIDVDLDRIREAEVGMPALDLRRWYFYVYPNLACDLTKQYIYVGTPTKDFARGKIIVSRTERYLNHTINYSFLRDYDCIFAGTDGERKIFNEQFDLEIPLLEVHDFLELAQALEQCDFLLSNQTQIFQLAAGLKTPRVVEICPIVPNVIVTEENAYDFLSQVGLEYYVKTLSKQAA